MQRDSAPDTKRNPVFAASGQLGAGPERGGVSCMTARLSAGMAAPDLSGRPRR